jgi:hypothetical protein
VSGQVPRTPYIRRICTPGSFCLDIVWTAVLLVNVFMEEKKSFTVIIGTVPTYGYSGTSNGEVRPLPRVFHGEGKGGWFHDCQIQRDEIRVRLGGRAVDQSRQQFAEVSRDLAVQSLAVSLHPLSH